MNKPIAWFHPMTGPEDRRRVMAVLKSNYINDGSVTREFEEKLAKFLGVPHCVAVTSGTSALTLALLAAGVGRGDEVLIPDLTFIATANAVRLAGAEPVLVEVRPGRLDLDCSKLKSMLTRRTKAVVPVDVNGRGADYDFLIPFCRENGLALVTDSAEALGSVSKGRMCGTVGSAGCFSFSPNKTLTTGQGGLVATRKKEIYHRLLELKDQGRRAQGSGGDDLHPVMGYNFKLTNLQAAVGLAQFEKLSARLKRSKERDAWYLSVLKDAPGVVLPDYSDPGEVRQWTDVLIPKGRDKVTAALDAKNIGWRAFWFPLHRQAPYRRADKGFENSIRISGQGLWLASSFDITKEQAIRSAETVRETAGKIKKTKK